MNHPSLPRGAALVLCLLLAAPASAATITYFADDNLNFDVLIEGNGAIGIAPTENSPSGFWSFIYQVEDVGGFPNVGEIQAIVQRLQPALGGFITPLAAVYAYDELPAIGSDTAGGDTINAVFTLNSGVALEDWDWSLRLTREGTSTSVPDGASTATLLGLVALAMFAPKVLRSRARAGRP